MFQMEACLLPCRVILERWLAQSKRTVPKKLSFLPMSGGAFPRATLSFPAKLRMIKIISVGM